jgi:hypothetical protein
MHILSALLLPVTLFSYPLPQPDDKPLDCAIRSAAHDFAVTLQGGTQLELFNALNLSSYCGMSLKSSRRNNASDTTSSTKSSAVFARGGGLEYCLNALDGSDSNPGTSALPFQSLPRGVAACRVALPSSLNCTLLLNDAAPFILTETLLLGAADSGLAIVALPSSSPVVSGATSILSSAWSPFDVSNGRNIWRTQVPTGSGATVPEALYVAGRRFPRARYPNELIDWETDRVPDGYTNASAWHTPRTAPPAVFVPFPEANRPFDAYFPNWNWARGGIAFGNFEPPEGYWIAQSPPAGQTWTVPSGMNYTIQQWSPRAATWDVSNAIVKVFHGEYWGSWAFKIMTHDAQEGSITFGTGGYQEARGWNFGGALYVENVRQELDAPREWYAFSNGTVDLFWPAASGTPPPNDIVSLAAGGLEQLIIITGTPTSPAKDIIINGLTFTGTQPTFLARPFVAPSGGDWSFSDASAVYLNGTARTIISDCLFTGIGGNAIILRGWNRDVRIERTIFTRLGESAIVTAGRAYLGNLSALDVPAGTHIINCSFSNLGVDVKQAGGLYSALSANTSVTGSLFYSLPRAAINFNDGAHGGHFVSRNIFAATVLETADQ